MISERIKNDIDNVIKMFKKQDKFLMNLKDKEFGSKLRQLFEQKLTDKLKETSVEDLLNETFDFSVENNKTEEMTFREFIASNNLLLFTEQMGIFPTKNISTPSGSNHTLAKSNSDVITSASSSKTPPKTVGTPVTKKAINRLPLTFNSFHSENFDEISLLIEDFAKLDNSSKPSLPVKTLLAIQGGGAKGAAYPGIIRIMKETGDLDAIKVCAGASAGAITAFLIGFGFNADQISRISKSVNFSDFCDYTEKGDNVFAKFVNILTTGYHYSGINFYNWSSSIIEHVTGDANITFKEYAALCKNNSCLKEIIFKGYRYKDLTSKNANGEVTFSANDTPNVLLADALRASMSFPFAFKPWIVRNKLENKITDYCEAADGGLSNNLPIDAFDNNNTYANPSYPNVYTTTDNVTSHVNPCSIGLSLCGLNSLNPQIHPVCDTAAADNLKNMNNKHASHHIDERSDTVRFIANAANNLVSWIAGSTIFNATKAAYDNKVGTATLITPENVKQKTEFHKKQIVQIYNHEVDALEFALSKEKQKILENSARESYIKYLREHQAPEAVYKNEYKQNTTKLSVDNIKEYFKSLFFLILTEAFAKEKHPLEEYCNAMNNQRIKFLAFQISEAKNWCENNLTVNAYQATMEDAFNEARSLIKTEKTKRTEHEKLLENIVDNTKLRETIRNLVTSDNIEDHQKASRLLIGQLSNIFSILREDGDKTIISDIIASGNHTLFTELYNKLTEYWNMLEQHDTRLNYTVNKLLNDTSKISLYSFAMTIRDQAKKIETIKQLLNKEVDPLQMDSNGKNAFHYAIDDAINSNNLKTHAELLKTLEVLIQWSFDNNIELTNCYYGRQNETLGHYIIKRSAEVFVENKNTALRFITQLSLETKLIIKLVAKAKAKAKAKVNYQGLDCQDNDTVNYQGLNCLDLASDLLTANPPFNNQDLAKTFSCSLLSVASLGTTKDFNDASAFIVRSNLGEKKDKFDSKTHLNYKDEIDTLKEKPLKEVEFCTEGKIDANLALEILQHKANSTPDRNTPSFLQSSALKPELADLIIFLCKNIIANDGAKKSVLLQILEKSKFEGKSILYLAAEGNNSKLITFLRNEIDADVNDAGPIDNPCALNRAAYCGSHQAIRTILQSKPSIPINGYKKITRKLVDENGKSALHHLAKNGLGYDIYEFLTADKNLKATQESFYYLTNQLDHEGRSPFYYLLQNENAIDIIRYIKLRKPAAFFSSISEGYDWHLEDIFNLNENREDDLTDLTHLYLLPKNKVSIELIQVVEDFIYDKNIIDNAKGLAQMERDNYPDKYNQPSEQNNNTVLDVTTCDPIKIQEAINTPINCVLFTTPSHSQAINNPINNDVSEKKLTNSSPNLSRKL